MIKHFLNLVVYELKDSRNLVSLNVCQVHTHAHIYTQQEEKKNVQHRL